MSDDTRSDPLVATGHAEESADDPTIDTFATITVTVDVGGRKQTIEFRTKVEDLDVVMESFGPEGDEVIPNCGPLVRIQPSKRKFHFGLSAHPVSDPLTGVAYTITKFPPG